MSSTNMIPIKKLKKQKAKQVVVITSKEHRDELLSNHQVVIIKYTATWCGPCKAIHPKYEQMCKENPDHMFCSEDVDEEFEGWGDDISSIPVFHIYNKGDFHKKVAGNMELLTEELSKLTKPRKVYEDDL